MVDVDARYDFLGGEGWLVNETTCGKCIAVTDGSYMQKIHPHLLVAAFLFENEDRMGQLVSSFSEESRTGNAYGAELMGLMAILLTLWSLAMARPGVGEKI